MRAATFPRFDSPFSPPFLLFRNHQCSRFQGLAHFLKRRIPEEYGEGTAATLHQPVDLGRLLEVSAVELVFRTSSREMPKSSLPVSPVKDDVALCELVHLQLGLFQRVSFALSEQDGSGSLIWGYLPCPF